MTDQCKNCIHFKNFDTCCAEDCQHHDNWYAVELKKKLSELTSATHILAKDYADNTALLASRDELLREARRALLYGIASYRKHVGDKIKDVL